MAGGQRQGWLCPRDAASTGRPRRPPAAAPGTPLHGDPWIFLAPGDGSEPCSRHLFRDWWQQGEALAGIPHQAGLGWHSLRRKFATELKHIPLKDLCYLGGWKEPQTVLKCYQQPDELTMRGALTSRRSVGR